MNVEKVFDRLSSDSSDSMNSSLSTAIRDDKFDTEELAEKLSASDGSSWKEDFRSYQRQDQEIFLKAMEDAQKEIIKHVLANLAAITEKEYSRIQHKVEESLIQTEEDIEKKLSETNSEIENVQETVDRLEDNIDTNEERLDDEKEARKEDLDNLQNKINEAIDSKDSLETKVEDLENKIDRKIKELEDLKDKTADIAEKNKAPSEGEENISEISPDISKKNIDPGEVSKKLVGEDVKIKGRVEYRKNASGHNFYKISGGGDSLVLRSVDRIPEGKRTVEGKIKEINGNLCITAD